MISEGVPIARLFGIEIRVSIAWVALLAIVVLLGAEQAAAVAPELAPGVQWLVGAAVAVAFLVSVLAHELAHALTARRLGVEPGPVVLGFVGGLAPLDVQAARPRDELVIALAGPLLSFMVAVGASTVAVGIPGDGATAAVAGGVLVIGALNAILAILSLMPGMPLDGGRVVRAIAWARTGDPDRASAITATIGRLTGWVLGGAGAFVAVTLRPSEGLMILSLGWFLATGARALQRRLAVQALFRGVPVRAVMEQDLPELNGSLTLDTFVDRFGGPDGATSLPVIADDAPVGVIGMAKIRRIGRKAWATTRAGDVMTTPPSAPFLRPDDPVWTALELLQKSGVDGLAVVEDGRLAGMLTRRAAAEAIRDRLAAGSKA